MEEVVEEVEWYLVVAADPDGEALRGNIGSLLLSWESVEEEEEEKEEGIALIAGTGVGASTSQLS